MRSIIPINEDSSTLPLRIENASMDIYGGQYGAEYVSVEHPAAGWVICSTHTFNGGHFTTELTTFLLIDGSFQPNGTGHEHLFETQQAAIRHILEKGLRGCWTVWKMC